VAFATIACSKLIFEPSANEVTIAGFCPSAPPTLLRRRVAVRVLQPLDVAHDARDEAQPLTHRYEVHLHARLVAVAGGEDRPVLAA
jgi:hypothetical protein